MRQKVSTKNSLIIEKRLIDITEKAIEQNDEADLAKDDFNPFVEINPFTPYSIANEIFDEFTKKK